MQQTIIIFATLLVCFVWVKPGFAEEVAVSNFPEKQLTQDINSIPKSHMGRIEGVEVPPVSVDKTDFSEYFLDTKGYAKASVNLFGSTSEIEVKNCRVGVLMLPNESAIVESLKNDRFMGLVEELSTGIGKDKKFFQGQVEMDIKFPSYRLGFYNTCGKKVTINFYAYLK